MLRSNSLGGAAGREIEKLVAGQHQAGVVEEGQSRRNSAVLNGTRDPVLIHQLAPSDIEMPAIEARSPWISLSLLRRQAVHAPQHRLDARQELARIERLGQIIVGADLEADDAIGLLGHGGQEDDRQFVVLRRWRQRERPSSPGIMMSSTMRSNALRSRSRRKAAAFSAT